MHSQADPAVSVHSSQADIQKLWPQLYSRAAAMFVPKEQICEPQTAGAMRFEAVCTALRLVCVCTVVCTLVRAYRKPLSPTTPTPEEPLNPFRMSANAVAKD